MKKLIVVLILIVTIIFTTGCIEQKGDETIGEQNSEFVFETIFDGKDCDIVYDIRSKLVYYCFSAYSEWGGKKFFISPYYLPDGSIAIYGETFSKELFK